MATNFNYSFNERGYNVQVTLTASGGPVGPNQYLITSASGWVNGSPVVQVNGINEVQSNNNIVTSTSTSTGFMSGSNMVSFKTADGTNYTFRYAPGSGGFMMGPWDYDYDPPHLYMLISPNGGISVLNGSYQQQIISSPPNTEILSALLSNDTGSSNNDFITNDATQTISGTLSANLASGEFVEVSFDNGVNWTNATSYTVGLSSWSHSTTLFGSNTFKARVSNADGGGTAFSKAYTLDATPPAAPSAPDLSFGSDTGVSNSDSITSSTNPTLTGTAESGSIVTLYDSDGVTVLGSTTATGGVWSITTSTLSPGSHTLTAKSVDAAGNTSVASSGLTVLVDTTAPAVSGVTLPANGTYKAGDHLDISVSFDQDVTVNTGGGTPFIAITLNTGGTVQASYVSGSGGTTLLFRHVVQAGELDTDGITVGTLSTNGATIQDAAGNNAQLTLSSLGSTAGILIDGVAPTVSGIARVSNELTNATSVDFTVSFSESVTGVDVADFFLSTTDTATGSIASVSAINASTYEVTVNSVSGAGTLRLDLKNSATGISDSASNPITTGYTSGQSYTIDHYAPASTSVAVPTNGNYGVGQHLDFTVTFDENVTVTTGGGTPYIALTFDSGGPVRANYLSGSGTNTLVFRYTIVNGDADANGVTVGSLNTNGGTIRDAAGNDVATLLNSVGDTSGVRVDAVPPSTPSAPNMTAGTDTGLSNTDNITSDSTPTFIGTAEANSNVTLYDTDGTTVLGTATANGAGNWIITSSALSSGAHFLTVKAADNIGNISSASSALTVTIDTTAPTTSVTNTTVAVGSNVTTAQSSEVGQVYLVDATASVTDLASLDALVNASSATQATVSVANTDTSLSTTGLATGTYRIFAVDMAGNVSAASASAITLVSPDPVVTTSGGSAAFTAGDNTPSTPVVIDSGITLTDPDSSTLSSATVAITGNFQNGEDVLSFTNDNSTSFGNITASYNSGTGVLTLTSSGATATVAQWQAALRSVIYTDTAITPNEATRTISFNVSDGGNTSSTSTRSITVSPTDQTPILGTSNSTTNYTANASAVVVDAGITLSDLDSATQSSATVSITGGFQSQDTLAFTNNGATMGNIAASYNSGTGVLTLTSAGATATNAQWEAALESVTFASSSTTAGDRTISFVISDGTKSSAAVSNTIAVVLLPTTTISAPSFSNDSGASTTDFITNTAAQTISGNLSANLAAGETVQVSLDDGNNWTTATTTVGQNTWSLSGQILTASNTLKVRVVDNANNAGPVFSQAYVLDTTAPTTLVDSASFSADSGSSNSDFITSTSVQTITGTLSANLASGETVQISLDNGATWANASAATVGQNTWSLTGQTLTGSNTLKVRVVDTAGNTGTEYSQAYAIDATAPTSAVTAAQVTLGGNVSTAQSSEVGRVYLVSDTANVTDLASLDALVAANSATQATVSVANTDTSLGTTGLAAGTYKIYAVDAAGNVSAASTNTVNLLAPAGGGGDVSTPPPITTPVAGITLLNQRISGSGVINGGFGNSLALQSQNGSTQDLGNFSARSSFMGASDQIASIIQALGGQSSGPIIDQFLQQILQNFGSPLESGGTPLFSPSLLETLGSRASGAPPASAAQAAPPNEGPQFAFYQITDFDRSNSFAVDAPITGDVINFLLITNGPAQHTQTVDVQQFQGVIEAGTGIHIHGLTSANFLIAAGQGTYSFGDGNQRLVLNGPNATVNGGEEGIQSVQFNGVSLANALISRNEGRVEIEATWSGNNRGVTTLNQVARAEFSDKSVAFDTARGDNAGEIFRLYEAAFNRSGDQGGIGYWLYQRDHQASLADIAHGFIQSDEFAGLYGKTPTNAAFIEALYKNVLDRHSDTDGFNYWLTQLNNGAAKENILIAFSESKECVANSAAIIANGIHYQDWSPQ